MKAIQLFEKAREAGKQAGTECNPIAMIVRTETRDYHVPDGPCGFAWVQVKCTNGPSRKFMAQLRKAGLAGDENSHKTWTHSSYYGGFLYWVHFGNQSIQRKEAYAQAMAKVLSEAGIDARAYSRLD